MQPILFARSPVSGCLPAIVLWHNGRRCLLSKALVLAPVQLCRHFTEQVRMTTQSITLHLSDPVYRYLQQVAAITKRPLEQLVRQSVEGNLPPSVENAPQELQDELLAMQSLSPTQLISIAGSQLPQSQQERYLLLLEQNSTGGISTEDSAEMEALRLAADRLMVRKGYALAVLRWRGHSIPPLAELPVG